MKQLIFSLLLILTVNISLSQQVEKYTYCNCLGRVDETTPDLNGEYELRCNGILTEKGMFASGLKHGEWVTYSQKGKLIRKVNYQNGLMHGKVELFFLDNKPKLIGEFDNGNKIGKWTYYTTNGAVLTEGSYASNKPIGVWTINNIKGKKPVVQYDYDAKKYLTNKSAPSHKDASIIQSENTETWYILKLPEQKYASPTEPLGGYQFANYMLVSLAEIPIFFWDTNIYQIHKVSYTISEDSEMSFDSQLFTGNLPSDHLALRFLAITNPKEKIKQVNHSETQLKLLELKFKEALNLMPPWVYNEQSEVDVYLNYMLNLYLHSTF